MYRLTNTEIRIIEDILNNGDRVELIPLKDRIKIIEIKREDVSPKYPIIIKEYAPRTWG